MGREGDGCRGRQGEINKFSVIRSEEPERKERKVSRGGADDGRNKGERQMTRGKTKKGCWV